VLVRLSHGHIRIGTFQRLAYERDAAGMRAARPTTSSAISTAEAPGAEPAVRLHHGTSSRGPRVSPRSYMAAGFVHGVLNTDNINVTGESFDYGPWRFAPDAGTPPSPRPISITPASTPSAASPRRSTGTRCSLPPGAARADRRERPADRRARGRSRRIYQRRRSPTRLLWRLGVTPRGMATTTCALVRTLERTIRASEVAIDRLFFDVFGATLPDSYGSAWDDLRAALAPYAPRKSRDHAYWQGGPCSMLIDEVEAIWDPIAAADDWSRVHAKVAAIRAMGDALA
jgi:serine/tyrosine/threonine adenylyltransferase